VVRALLVRNVPRAYTAESLIEFGLWKNEIVKGLFFSVLP
jgi:hypothetical protein